MNVKRERERDMQTQFYNGSANPTLILLKLLSSEGPIRLSFKLDSMALMGLYRTKSSSSILM